MKRWINDGVNLEYKCYDTNEKLVGVSHFPNDKEILNLSFYGVTENRACIEFIYTYVENQDLKKIVSCCQKDIIGFRKSPLTNYDPVEGIIETEEFGRYLIYRMLNPSFIGWNILSENKKEIEVYIFLGGIEKYELIVKKGSLFKIYEERYSEENKEDKVMYIKNKIPLIEDKSLEIKINYKMPFTNEEVNEKLNSKVLFKKRKTLIFKGIEEYDEKQTDNLYLRIHFLYDDKYKIILQYNLEKIGNYQYSKDNRKLLLDNDDELKKVFLWRDKNSTFFVFSIYDYLIRREYVEDEEESHLYVTDDYIIEIITKKNNYPEILVENISGNEVRLDEIFDTDVTR